MPTCPTGHTSASTDYCDVCGTLMGGAPPSSEGAPSPAGPAPGSGSVPGLPPDGTCPDCSTPRVGRFCEECGYDYTTGISSRPYRSAGAAPAEDRKSDPNQRSRPAESGPRPPGPASAPEVAQPPITPGSWVVVISADAAYYQSQVDRGELDPDSIVFPPYCPPRRVPLTGERIRIGRSSTSRGIIPEIDLNGPPQDPAVSHVHAVLLSKPDDSWSLVDPGSANGTVVNGSPDLLAINTEVPLSERDRIHVGAWTLITLRRG